MTHISLTDASLVREVVFSRNVSLKKQMLNILLPNRLKHQKKALSHALTKVSLNLVSGDRLAIIGRNGSGKSSLLKLCAGIYPPSEGQVETEGKIVSLIGFTAGFDYERSGEENLYIRGRLLGLSKYEVAEIIDKVIELAELQDYRQLPLKVYSSGMVLRLAYSLALWTKPDILLIDEVLNTGDVQFLEKTQNLLENFINETKIMMFASHDVNSLRKYCNKGLILDNGKIKFIGDLETAINNYQGGVTGNMEWQ